VLQTVQKRRNAVDRQGEAEHDAAEPEVGDGGRQRGWWQTLVRPGAADARMVAAMSLATRSGAS
jgi:hypothetical protein